MGLTKVEAWGCLLCGTLFREKSEARVCCESVEQFDALACSECDELFPSYAGPHAAIHEETHR